MLIGKATKRPNLVKIRNIKNSLSKALNLTEDEIITVSQLACLEIDCAPVETVFGLLRPGVPQLQFKIHKEIDHINSQDLLNVCIEWGFDVQISTITQFFTFNQ